MTKDMKNRGDAIFSAAMMAGLMFSAVPAVAQEFAPEQIELIVPYGAGGGSTIH